MILRIIEYFRKVLISEGIVLGKPKVCLRDSLWRATVDNIRTSIITGQRTLDLSSHLWNSEYGLI